MTIVSNSNAESTHWANYLDITDVQQWLQISPVNTISTGRLQLLLEFACQNVQEFLGRPIAPTTFFRRFDGWTGWNGAYVMLPYYPVLEIVSVTEWWGVSGPHTLIEQTPSTQSSQDAFQLVPLTGQLRRVFPGLVQRPWFPGSRNIEVTWVAGYNPLPATIKVATLELIAHWWRNTQQQSGNRPGGPGGDYDPLGQGAWDSMPHFVKGPLAAYKQKGIA